MLCGLLGNLPSTIFKEKEIADLITEFDRIRQRNTENGKSIGTAFDIYKSHSSGSGASEQDPDADVAALSPEAINALKVHIESLYLSESEDRNRYGLMTLIFHLLKQIVVHQSSTKMTAESLSRIFVNVLESKLFLMKCVDPTKLFRMHFLVKTLIFHSYTVFVEQQWQIKDIVVASNCEIATVTLYAQFCRIRNKNKSQKWRQKFILQKVEPFTPSIHYLHSLHAFISTLSFTL